MRKNSNWTVNVSGNHVERAKGEGYHAYYANGVTAIEIKGVTKQEAERIAEQIAGNVLYIFE